MKQQFTLLIIDDDEDDKEMLIDAATEVCSSVKCVKASNGQEALLLLKNEKLVPDFIFLDLNMPRMNGRQCLIELKKNEKLQSIPIIIYTTSKLDVDKEETRSLGAVHFITKPSSMNTLKKELEFVFEQEWVAKDKHC